MSVPPDSTSAGGDSVSSHSGASHLGSSRSGCKPGRYVRPVCSPICFPLPLCSLFLALFVSTASAQNAGTAQSPQPPAAAAAVSPATAKNGKPSTAAARPQARPEWRDVSGYRFPAVGKTVADMQNAAHAMRLRDYCADARVKDEFVRERLTRFSAITGREETCRTLLDY